MLNGAIAYGNVSIVNVSKGNCTVDSLVANVANLPGNLRVL